MIKMNKPRKKSKPPHLISDSGFAVNFVQSEHRCGGKEKAVLGALDALRTEVAELAESQRTLGLAFRTLENRYDALETLLRHMQAAKLGHGPSDNDN